jgi:hypothetical protein
MRDAQLSGNDTGAAGEVQGRPLAGQAPDFQFLPGDAVLDTGAERLGAGFLGGKACGKTLSGGGSGAAIRDFLFGKHAVQKSLAEAIDGARDARHLHQIDSGSHEHEATVAQGETFSVPGHGFVLMVRLASSDGSSVHELAEPNGVRIDWNMSLTALCSDDAPRTVRFLTGAVLACGGNVLARRFEPGETAAIEFEFVRATCVEMYSILIAAGLELSAEAHLTMASLCQCTRETLEATAGDPVRVLLSIRKAGAKARCVPGGACTPPQAA